MSDSPERAVFFVGRVGSLFKTFAPWIHGALNGRIAGYLSDRYFHDGEFLIIGGHQIPTVNFGEFSEIAQAMPIEIVHFFENLEDMWCIPSLSCWGDVQVVDFLTKLDALGLPHTYQLVREERIWWNDQDNEQIRKVANRLTDARSRNTLVGRVNAIRRAERTPLLEVAFDNSNEYFNPRNPRASFVPGPEEIYVDVGAAHGDTVERFLGVTGGRFRHIYAFEPTPGQFRQLSRLSQTPGIETFRNAVGAERGSITFYDNAQNPFGGNAVSPGTGTPIEVDCVRLDDAVPECTLIKMDVEGYECNVIEGARGLIEKCRPDMAITCYHYPQDLFQILEKVDGIHSYRNVALRHYGPSLYDSVLLFSDRQSFDASRPH
ncbi:MAG: FkbM family methyltransferase [Burkholderiales bacterium]|nr:FkbM family methyltransferase [Burkholderiales bacterium]